MLELPALMEGWPDIARELQRTGRTWPLAAIRFDVKWFRRRAAIADVPMPPNKTLQERWNVPHVNDVRARLEEAPSIENVDTTPNSGRTVPVIVSEEELALLLTIDERPHVAARTLLAPALHNLCPGGRLAAGGTLARSVCPVCGAILKPRDGHLPAHERRPAE